MSYYAVLGACLALLVGLFTISGDTGGVATLKLVFVLVTSLALAGIVIAKTVRASAT